MRILVCEHHVPSGTASCASAEQRSHGRTSLAQVAAESARGSTAAGSGLAGPSPLCVLRSRQHGLGSSTGQVSVTAAGDGCCLYAV